MVFAPPGPLWWVHHCTSSRKSALLPVAYPGKEGMQIQGLPPGASYPAFVPDVSFQLYTPDKERFIDPGNPLCGGCGQKTWRHGPVALTISDAFLFLLIMWLEQHPDQLPPAKPYDPILYHWPPQQLPIDEGTVTLIWVLMLIRAIPPTCPSQPQIPSAWGPNPPTTSPASATYISRHHVQQSALACGQQRCQSPFQAGHFSAPLAPQWRQQHLPSCDKSSQHPPPRASVLLAPDSMALIHH